MEKDKDQNLQQKKNQLNAYVRYSGMAIQMIVTMLLAVWGGMKLDEHFQVKSHLFTIFLLVFAVVGSMYLMIRGLTKNQ